MTESKPKNDTLHFDIDASIVFQLGESLITDVIQALVELVKNSYDADATSASIVVDTQASPGNNSAFPEARGYLRIQDNGCGMDFDTIQNGWLFISRSLKRDLKREKKTTASGRTPLGDKGLGRLGSQRLGDNLEIVTRQAGSNIEHQVSLSWRDFRTAQALSKVSVDYKAVVLEPSPSHKRGRTILTISDLRDPDVWIGEGITQLQSQLSQMLSPYKAIQDFIVVATINGQELELADISEKLRETAELRFVIDFDREPCKNAFCVHGRARLDYFRPGNQEDKELFAELVESDKGQRFFEWLASQPQAKTYQLRRSTDSGWFLMFGMVRMFENFDNLQLIGGVPANPGPFHAELDAFDLDREKVSGQSVLDNKGEYKKYLQNYHGMRIYRDGFGIRVDRDWLNLSKSWTSGGSWYTLRPNNILGYVALSARDNGQLEETTDREGFIEDTPYYRNFYTLFQEFVTFSGRLLEFMRRGWLAYRNEHREQRANIRPSMTTTDISKQVQRGLAKAPQFRASLEQLRGSIREQSKTTQVTLDTIEIALEPNSNAQEALQAAKRALAQSDAHSPEVIAQLETYMQEVSSLDQVYQVVADRLEVMQEQITQMYEVASLGLTAESLSHEMLNIVDQLAHRNRQIIDYLRTQRNRDARLISFTEYINSSVAGLRKQLSHLSPSLKYVRERREQLKLVDVIHDLVDYHRSRFSNIGSSLGTNQPHLQLDLDDIGFQVESETSNFILLMNKGKLFQIFDNLILNSEYWLREAIRTGRIDRGIISFDIENPIVRVSDNGIGIDPSVEDSLFFPFVTMKGQGRGRGIGLFVVQQLLASEGCTIRLLPDRNAHDRRYIFEINFTGVVSGGP